jgi:hypothetical protein
LDYAITKLEYAIVQIDYALDKLDFAIVCSELSIVNLDYAEVHVDCTVVRFTSGLRSVLQRERQRVGCRGFNFAGTSAAALVRWKSLRTVTSHLPHREKWSRQVPPGAGVPPNAQPSLEFVLNKTAALPLHSQINPFGFARWQE